MRTVAVAVVVVASAFGLTVPVGALPPDDLAAYCRAAYPQVPFQIRCMSLERASQERVAAARSALDQTTWERCQSGSASWTAMETCLAQPATANSPAPGGAIAPGTVIPPAGAVAPGGAPAPGTAGAAEPGDDRVEARRQGGNPGTPEAAAPASGEARGVPPGPPQPPSSVASPSGSTIILGPQPNPVTSAPAENRPTRPVSEAEADRQLRNILERTGGSAARCTKRQYGPGWVIVCD